MTKTKLFFAALALMIAAGTAWFFIPTHVTLGKEVLSRPIAGEFKLVGYKSLSTDPATTGQIHYFVLGLNDDAAELEPFLITTDPFIRISNVGENTFHLTINGKISQYYNDLWVTRSDGTVQHWLVSADSNYVR